jgi:hypothetical protein
MQQVQDSCDDHESGDHYPACGASRQHKPPGGACHLPRTSGMKAPPWCSPYRPGWGRTPSCATCCTAPCRSRARIRGPVRRPVRRPPCSRSRRPGSPKPTRCMTGPCPLESDACVPLVSLSRHRPTGVSTVLGYEVCAISRPIGSYIFEVVEMVATASDTVFTTTSSSGEYTWVVVRFRPAGSTPWHAPRVRRPPSTPLRETPSPVQISTLGGVVRRLWRGCLGGFLRTAGRSLHTGRWVVLRWW